MINLLPPVEKKELICKKKSKITIILGFVFLFFLVCLMLVLFSEKIYLLGENLVLKENLDEINKKYNSESLTMARKFIKDYNKTLAGLDSFYNNQVYFTDALRSLLNIAAPKGIYFIDINIDRKNDGFLQINLYGFSDSRDNLLTFKSNIEKEKLIKNPTFSADSWVKSQNINFYLTFQYDNKN